MGLLCVLRKILNTLHSVKGVPEVESAKLPWFLEKKNVLVRPNKTMAGEKKSAPIGDEIRTQDLVA